MRLTPTSFAGPSMVRAACVEAARRAENIGDNLHAVEHGRMESPVLRLYCGDREPEIEAVFMSPDCTWGRVRVVARLLPMFGEAGDGWAPVFVGPRQ